MITDDDGSLEDRLLAERPLPSPMFRSRLRNSIVRVQRPAGLWRLAAAFGSGGTLCLASVGAGLAGLGPFAA